MKSIKIIIDKYLMEIAFFISAAATAGSLILSLVVGLEPCTLCWYQRILLFPVPIILAIGVFRKDKYAFTYILPFITLGLIISGYHTLLQWGVLEEALKTCSATGPPCDEPEIAIFGFLTIPFGSFLTFLSVSALMLRKLYLDNYRLGFVEKQDRLLGWMILVLGIGAAVAILLVNLL